MTGRVMERADRVRLRLELIGRPVPDYLPDAPGGDAQMILSADPDDPDTVNAVIAGAVHGVGLGKPSAVAVNGRVGGGDAHRRRGRGRAL